MEKTKAEDRFIRWALKYLEHAVNSNEWCSDRYCVPCQMEKARLALLRERKIIANHTRKAKKKLVLSYNGEEYPLE